MLPFSQHVREQEFDVGVAFHTLDLAHVFQEVDVGIEVDQIGPVQVAECLPVFVYHRITGEG